MCGFHVKQLKNGDSEVLKTGGLTCLCMGWWRSDEVHTFACIEGGFCLVEM